MDFMLNPSTRSHAIDSAHGGAGRRRQRRRRHGNDLQRIQRRASALLRAKLSDKVGGYTVGVLVQCNYGVRRMLRIAGVPVGKEIPEDPLGMRIEDTGSIIVVVATDAPLLPIS